MGVPFGYFTYQATAWFWEPLGLALAIVACGYITKTLFLSGYQHISISANHVGVAVRLGDKPTGWLYSAGDHWGFPGISGAIEVDMRKRRIDLRDKFTASAGDTSDVSVDGFLFVRTTDPFRAINVDDLDESLRELLESRIRFFASIISKAENAVKFRDLLADYLELEPRETAVLTPEHKAFRSRLLALQEDWRSRDGIDALMAQGEAGALKRLANAWGNKIEEVEIEQIDIPQEIKDANVKKAVQAALMDAEQTRNNARATMVKNLVDAGVNANTAMNSVDMLLKLNVKKDIQEIAIADLDKVAGAFGNVVTKLLQKFSQRQET